MDFSRLSKPKGTLRDSRQVVWQRQTWKGQAQILPGCDGSRVLSFSVAWIFSSFKSKLTGNKYIF